MDRDEAIDLLKGGPNGVREWNEWRRNGEELPDLRDADFTESSAKLDVPTLCICGSEDGATTPDVVRSTAQLIPGARFELIEGAGHLPCIEAPDAVANLILEFTAETVDA